ncbi:MAG: hypothetical protein MJ188_07605 [Treponema sp.]|nr:hypothetical protein [Treponema sp.]
MINVKKLLVKNCIMLGMFIAFGISCFIMGKRDSTYLGFTIGGISVVMLSTIRVIKMMKNEDYKKQVEIEAKDERSKMINEKTSEVTNFVMSMICCVCGFLSMLFDKKDYLIIFGGLLIIFALVYFISKTIFNKKY